MARFSANVSDSSDDEDNLYAGNTNKSSSRYAAKSKVGAHNSEESEESEDDEMLEDENEDEDEDTEDESSVSGSSDMHEEELVVSRSRSSSKQNRNALIEDSDGEYRYAHEVNGRTRSPISSESESESDSDSPSARRRESSAVIPWARHVGVDAQKMHVMQTSLFRMPEEAAALKAMNRPARPRFQLSPSVSRKHSRDSEGDGLRIDPRERASFAHDIDPLPFRPTRKYSRVESSASSVVGNENALADAGLTLGRSFRSGWGPKGTLVHLGHLCGPDSQLEISANTSAITKTSVPLFYGSADESTGRISRLLQHHLSSTVIARDEYDIPFADPSSDMCFASLASLYPLTDHSYEASLFRLGHALFDKLDLRVGTELTTDVRNRITSIRRKVALSAWLEEAVAPSIDAELKRQSSANSAALVYTHLTGNKIEKACEVAMDGGNVKLATLISQASGDFEFREDLREQLQIWQEQRIDVHVDENVRRIYALLAGTLDVVEGSKGGSLERCTDVDPIKGLDWKRAFGLHLWFSEPMDAPIAKVFESYERSLKESPERVAGPCPWYLQNQSQHVPGHPSSKSPSLAQTDALFSMIRLHAQPACSLSQVLAPLSFGPSPMDYSLPWHMYIILSRCMRVRDFSDRGDSGEHENSMSGDEDDEVHLEGHSPSADLLASSYAQQLEQLGMLQEAIFVLLHIEGPTGREKAIKDLLSRSAEKLDEWMTLGVLGSLKIPLSWVNEAKALYAIHNGKVFEAYELYVAAGLFQAAHDLAVAELAPEAVIRQDFDLLKSLFAKMANKSIDGWHLRGKAFVDYAHAMTRLPELHEHLSDPTAIPDASQELELDELSRSIPRLIGILPDVLCSPLDPRHKVALVEMISGLTSKLDLVKPLALSQMHVRLIAADETTKLRHLHTTAYDRFLKSIQVS